MNTSALHIPRRHRIDWLAAAVWWVLVPVSSALGWYGIWRTVHAIWNLV